MKREEKIEHVLRSLGLVVKVAHTFEGYSSDTFLIEMNAGTILSNLFKYKLDIANALSVASIRINKDLFVYEGKSYLCVEAQKKREKTLAFDPKELDGYKIPIGKDNFGETVVWDMENHSTPHMLVSGMTGSGKSVSLISTLEYALLAGMDDVYIFDPKYEFSSYEGRGNVQVYQDIDDIESIAALLVEDMNNRVRDGIFKRTLIIFDEFADAFANQRKGKKLGDQKALDENLRILLQKGRSLGFRIVSATQRASAKIISGDSKANYGVVLCFRLPKSVDSRVLLDEDGAESLSGGGDAIIKSSDYPGGIRIQGYFKE